MALETTPNSQIVPNAQPRLNSQSRKFRLGSWCLGIWVLPITLFGQSAAAQVAQDAQRGATQAQEPARSPDPVFSLRKYPSLRVGPVRLDVRAKSQAEWNDFEDHERDPGADVFDLRRARLGFEGRVTRHVEYQVERELRDDKRPWRDVYVGIRSLRTIRVQAGRFKMPFSLDQTTSVMDGSFAYRSLAARALAPSRDVGVMAFGGVLDNVLRYEAGFFRGGGDNAPIPGAGPEVRSRTSAARVVFRPWNSARARFGRLRSLTFGAAFTTGRVPEGLNSLRAETVTGDRLAEPVYVNGLRRRVGAEVQWRPGPVSMQGEFIWATDERRHQGIDNEDLPSVNQQGWYVSGTWLMTGEEKKNNVEPARPLFQGGLGAFELASRVEALSFGAGDAGDDVAWPGPRARRIAVSRDAAWTIGLNWYLNEFVKVQLNAIRERRDGDNVTPSEKRAWSRALRIQFQL